MSFCSDSLPLLFIINYFVWEKKERKLRGSEINLSLIIEPHIEQRI